ncbi:MAG: VOC family protein, partial [Enterococcus lemanii]
MMSFHQAPTTFVGQVNLKVSDLERSLQFYQKIIGFSILNQTDSSATLTADGQHPLLTITQP